MPAPNTDPKPDGQEPTGPVLDQIDELSARDRDKLRQKLNEKAKQERYAKMHATVEAASRGDLASARQIGAGLAALMDCFADDRYFQDKSSEIAAELAGVFAGWSHSWSADNDDANNLGSLDEKPEIVLEKLYQDAQNQVITFRQATAQAMATEKQLEAIRDKNLQRAETWKQRAEIARSQENTDLERQAEQRGLQFIKAAADLETQLKQQKEMTVKLRERLTVLENELQKTATAKQMLIARHKAMKATLKANRFFRQTMEENKNSPWQKAKKILDEAAAKMEAASADIETELEQNPSGEGVPESSNSRPVLTQIAEALERLNKTLVRLEEKLEA